MCGACIKAKNIAPAGFCLNNLTVYERRPDLHHLGPNNWPKFGKTSHWILKKGTVKEHFEQALTNTLKTDSACSGIIKLFQDILLNHSKDD